jgi:hypothetical protein
MHDRTSQPPSNSQSGHAHPKRDGFHTGAGHHAARPDPRSWPFAELTDQQQRQRSALECAMRDDRLRVFRAFDDTVAGVFA